jgi:hypothetical protein
VGRNPAERGSSVSLLLKELRVKARYSHLDIPSNYGKSKSENYYEMPYYDIVRTIA